MPKRPNPFEQYAAPSSVMAKRLRKVERTVNRNKPEMRHHTVVLNATITQGTINVAGLTNITQGDTITTRNGNRIKVWRIEIRGFSSGRLDHYIIQNHTNTAPVLADFTNTGGGSPTVLSGAFINDQSLNTNFTEWKHYVNPNGTDGTATTDDPIKMILRFKNGFTVKYEGSGSTPIDNGLSFVVANGSPNDRFTTLTARIWFTDC